MAQPASAAGLNHALIHSGAWRPGPGELGRSLALELLLRLWQQSDASPYRRAAGEGSLLLLDLPMELMHEQLHFVPWP